MWGGVLLPLLAALAAAQTVVVPPTTRRPVITTMFMYRECATGSNGTAGTVQCGNDPLDRTRGLTSFVLSTVSNTGANDAYTFNTDDEYVRSFMPPNTAPKGTIAFTVEVGVGQVAYNLRPVITAFDRYALQDGKQRTCPPASLSCRGIATFAPAGEECTTEASYSNGGAFGNVTKAFPGLAFVPARVIFKSNDSSTWRCGASLCGVCRDVIGLTQRAECVMHRLLPVYPLWQVFRIEENPVYTVRTFFTFTSSDPARAPERVEIALNLDTSSTGNSSSRLFATAFDGAVVVSFMQMTSFFPFPGQANYLVMAERHPKADGNPPGLRPSDAAVLAGGPNPAGLTAMDNCPYGADAQGIYCPPANAWDEAQIKSGLNRGDLNPRPELCEPYSRWWFYAEQGRNGWRHGYEKFQHGQLPSWPLFNDGRNAASTCLYGPGYGTVGYDTGATEVFSVTRLPAFFPQQNRDQRASRLTGLPAPDRWTCDKRRGVNMPQTIAANDGRANVWPDGTVLRASLAAPANAFLEFAFDIAGRFMELVTLRSQGYMYLPVGGCALTQNDDGSFIVGVVNTGGYAADFGVRVECPPNGRYVVTSAEARISLKPFARGLIEPPINIRLQGDLKPGGDACIAFLIDGGTGEQIGTLEQQCSEQQIRRVVPLGAQNDGITAAPVCSFFNVFCKWGLEMLDWQALLLGLLFMYLLYYLIIIVIAMVGIPLYLKYRSGGGKGGAAKGAKGGGRRR